MVERSALATYAGRLSATALACLILAPSSARANGRYPNADQLVTDPGDPDHLVLRATFGTLDSRDGGVSWTWICEEAVGYTGDPAITILRGGSLLLAFEENVTFSSDQGCSWSSVPLSPERRFTLDVTRDAADPSRAWVLSASLDATRRVSVLDVDTSGGASISVMDGFAPSTIEVAQSRPERMYVVGLDGDFRASLLVSDDRGQSWALRHIEPHAMSAMYVSAVDPTNPDKLYLRVDEPTADFLLVSNDAGVSWSDVLRVDGEMLGLALSPDGRRIAAGGPDVGLHVASTTELQFQRVAGGPQSLRCLTWTARGLFACAQESIDGWTLALSTDDASTFTPLWHVQDLVPLECAASTSVGGVCPSTWLDIASRIGAQLVPGEDPERPPAKSESSCSTLPARTARDSVVVAWALAALLGLRRRVRQLSGAPHTNHCSSARRSAAESAGEPSGGMRQE